MVIFCASSNIFNIITEKKPVAIISLYYELIQDHSLLGCGAVQFCTWVPAFQRRYNAGTSQVQNHFSRSTHCQLVIVVVGSALGVPPYLQKFIVPPCIGRQKTERLSRPYLEALETNQIKVF
jgi:hypothetical protein